MPLRLNKYLSTNLGISRREADQLIADGRVSVDNKTAIIGDKVTANSKVTVGSESVKSAKLIYLTLNKPAGYVSSRKHQNTAPTLYELLPPKYQALKTVGRLDKDSSGLILLTNDGDFAFKMTHPKYFKTKVYQVSLDRPLAPLHQQMIADFGVTLGDGTSQLELLAMDTSRKNWQVTMHEGRNRQIRRTFGALGYTVAKLQRTHFGRYSLGDLKSGEWRLITQ